MKHNNAATPFLQQLASDRGAGILMLTTILSFAVLVIATSVFYQARSSREQTLRTRAKMHARYCAEYAVARYGVPAFMINSDLIDLGQDADNPIAPTSQMDIIDNAYQGEDMGFRFNYGYSDLKMDKVYDTASSRPFYFVSAKGIVTWVDHNGEDRIETHTSAVGLTFNDFSRFMYFSNGEVGPEGNPVRFGANEEWYGRIHINGAAEMVPSSPPRFYGFFTQTEETVIGLGPGQYENVFLGGWTIPFPEIAWPPQDALAQIKEQRTADHTYDEEYEDFDGITHRLTTNLKFRGRRYFVSQYYSNELDDDGDTIYVQVSGQTWAQKNLPTTPGRELIWVKGVARLEGEVTGKVTVLASDTMFLMDNIVTSDVILSPCPGDPPAAGDPFGTVPTGSPNRIGLASEGNIVIASTFANGFANGEGGGGTCGIPYSATDGNLGNVCGQGRRDIIITASMLAMNCSFETEFWNTTAYDGGFLSTGAQVEDCPGFFNNWIQLWDNSPGNDGNVMVGTQMRSNRYCPGGSTTQDRRGRIWICGSIVQTHRGFVIRNPIGPWGNRTIGYGAKVYRYDDNLIGGGPPVWFKVTYTDGSRDVATEMIVPDFERWQAERAAAALVN